jgi:hypothetical protein
MVGEIGLFEADHSLLGRPVQRQVDMRGEFQIGQFSTLGDRLDDFRREKRQPDEAGNVAISYALAAGDRGQRGRPAGNEFLEPRWARAIALSSAASGLRGGASAPSIMSRISTPRRFIRIAKNCVIAALPRHRGLDRLATGGGSKARCRPVSDSVPDLADVDRVGKQLVERAARECLPSRAVAVPGEPNLGDDATSVEIVLEQPHAAILNALPRFQPIKRG